MRPHLAVSCHNLEIPKGINDKMDGTLQARTRTGLHLCASLSDEAEG